MVVVVQMARVPLQIGPMRRVLNREVMLSISEGLGAKPSSFPFLLLLLAF